MLKKISLFSDFSDEEIGKLAPLFSERNYLEGEIIIPEHADNREMVILLSGAVAVEVALTLHQRSERLSLSMEEEPGRIIEWSVAIDTTRSGETASARALRPTRVLAADGEAILKICGENLCLGYRLMRRILLLIASRLKDTRMQLVSSLAQYT
ncbi:MAG: cyclic nucleotide-binding domain-containing protein [bacterium]